MLQVGASAWICIRVGSATRLCNGACMCTHTTVVEKRPARIPFGPSLMTDKTIIERQKSLTTRSKTLSREGIRGVY
jgi:hypothetical protein